MKVGKRRATLLLCSVALVAVTGAANARPVHHHHAARHHARHYATRHHAHHYVARHHARRYAVRHHAHDAYGGFTSSALVADARRYIGTNPTGRRSLWCGAFMDMVLRQTGHKGGGNLALGYLHYGHRVAGPQVGAIAVMGRRGGGHVGVVSGIDANGNPIIISGNHNHTVAESVYPRGRIKAYVEP
jgi:uncharacterized protein (TIGR02594 family)